MCACTSGYPCSKERGKGENGDTKARTRAAARAIRAIVKDSGCWVESSSRNAPKRGKTSENRINDRA